jgi:hypothetical protein
MRQDSSEESTLTASIFSVPLHTKNVALLSQFAAHFQSFLSRSWPVSIIPAHFGRPLEKHPVQIRLSSKRSNISPIRSMENPTSRSAVILPTSGICPAAYWRYPSRESYLPAKAGRTFHSAAACAAKREQARKLSDSKQNAPPSDLRIRIAPSI